MRRPRGLRHAGFWATDRGRLAIVDDRGNVEWEMPLKSQVHDLQRLPNGNILTHTGAATVVEINPAKEIVWTYTSTPRPGYNGPIEVHAVQRLDDGLTMIAESGNRRIIEVNREGDIVHSIDLKVEKPDSHRDTRLVRKLANGHYLVCQELDGTVHEYAPDGSIVWSYRLDLAGRPATPGHDGHGTEVFGALRLASGNTLIATGNGNRRDRGHPRRRSRLEHRPRRATGHPTEVDHLARPAPQRQHRLRQHPRRPRQSPTDRSHAGQEGRLDPERFPDVRQRPGRSDRSGPACLGEISSPPTFRHAVMAL